LWNGVNLIEKDYPKLSIKQQCDLLGVPRSSFYYKVVEDKTLELKSLIEEEYKCHPFYGYRKINKALERIGFNVTEKQVRVAMHKLGISAIYPKPKLSNPNKKHKKYPYLLKGLKLVKINQIWATDITYIKLKGGFVYLSAIIDLHSRKILTWRISNTLCVDFCIECLNEALALYDKPDIFNTDQGSQYTSDRWIDILKENNIKISMDGKGRALDNIYIERFWRSFKYEDLYLTDYKTLMELKGGVKDYINFYNDERFHQSLEYKTPNEIYYSK